MKFLKSITFSFWALIALIASPFSIGAQNTNQDATIPMARKAPGTREMLQQSLNLTDEQTKNLEPIFKEQQARMSALRTNTALSRQERMAAIKDMRKNADEKMKPHLTPEQLQKWEHMRGDPAAFSHNRATNRLSLHPSADSEMGKAKTPLAAPASSEIR